MIRTGPIVTKRKIVCLARRPVVPRRFDKKSKEKGLALKK